MEYGFIYSRLAPEQINKDEREYVKNSVCCLFNRHALALLLYNLHKYEYSFGIPERTANRERKMIN